MPSPGERDALFALMIGVVTRFEINAQTDVEAFRRVHSDVLRSLLDRHPPSVVRNPETLNFARF